MILPGLKDGEPQAVEGRNGKTGKENCCCCLLLARFRGEGCSDIL